MSSVLHHYTLPSSNLETCPTEVLSAIVLADFDHDDRSGPPARLLTYLILSKTIYKKLYKNTAFLRQLFLTKFDLTAPLRRFGRSNITSHAILSELEDRSKLLVRIRNFQSFPYDDEALLEADLWKMALMYMENDGLNEAQLTQYANLPRFMMMWANHYLTPTHATYPPENTLISLGLYLLWRVQDPDTVRQNALADNDTLMRALAPFNLVAFKVSTFAIFRSSTDNR